MKQTIRFYLWEIGHDMLDCPLTMAIPCKKMTMAACFVDRKCCPWPTNSFPEGWTKCKRFVMFLEEVKRKHSEFGGNPHLIVKNKKSKQVCHD